MNNSSNPDKQIVLLLDHMSIAPGNTHNLMEKCFDLYIDKMKQERQNLPGWKGVFYKVRDGVANIIFPFPLISDTKAASKYIKEIMDQRYNGELVR